MSSRRNTDPEIDETELRALLILRMLRAADADLLDLLPDYPPSEILRQSDARITDIVERRIEHALAELRRLNVRVITVANPAYPPQLAVLENLRPPVLFCRGRVELMQTPSVSVVGTRRCTEYGSAAAEMLAGDFARAGLTVISGLALGIDTCAHRAALETGGFTIAVLGCGIDVWYPQRNARLQERIANEGLLISEFCPGEPAMPHHFLQRNRLIAVLSQGLVVVEAGQRSGTTKTVKWAIDFNVDVFAVPGPIGREASVGTNQMILDGAIMITCSRDVIDQLPWNLPAVPARSGEPAATAGLGDAASKILSRVGPVAVQIDQIAREAGCEPAAALVLLAQLELAGLVRQLPGKRFVTPEIRTAR